MRSLLNEDGVYWNGNDRLEGLEGNLAINREQKVPS